MDQNMQQCIQNCLDCYRTCVETHSYCLRKGGEHAQEKHIRLLDDCIDICLTSANFMLRGSTLHPRTCGVCAEACAQCAQDCERMGDDAQMKSCADICRRCADSCRQMAGTTA